MRSTYLFNTLILALGLILTCASYVQAATLPVSPLVELATDQTQQLAFKGICPDMTVRCVLDGDWSHPIGYLGKRPFCRGGIRCNQCDEAANTRECNKEFPDCMRACEAYAPIPV